MPVPTTLDYSAERRISSPRYTAMLSLAILAGVFGYLLIYHIHHERRDRGHLGDFPTFYQAAQFAREHRDIYTAGHAESDQMYVYPPLIAFVYIPLTYLSLPNAAMVILFVTALELLASLLLGSRAMVARLSEDKDVIALPSLAATRRGALLHRGAEEHSPSGRGETTSRRNLLIPSSVLAVAALASLLSENELRAVMTMLETDSLMLLLFTLALFWLDRRPTLSGLALAFAFNIKYLSIVALPYLILRRRWKAASATVVGCAFFALLPALQLGWHEDLRCLRVSMGGLLRWVGVAPETSHSITVHNIADGLSVSITSALARVLGARGFTNPQIMAAAAGVGIAALLIVAMLYAACGFALWKFPPANKQRSQPFKGLIAMEWAGLVTVALAFSPNTNARHLVLAALVNVTGAALLLLPKPSVSRLPAVIGLALIVLGFTMPGAKFLRQHAGFNHYVYGVPCWCLLIGYLLILWVGLRYLVAVKQDLQNAIPTGIDT
jgi:hypothetical protein